MIICKEDACTGCMACISVCAKSAVTIVYDNAGFAHPQISEAKCVGCKRCQQICPVINQNKNKTIGQIYAAWQKNESERLAATSGGVFTIIAKKFIEDGGVVYGAAFDEDNVVKHIRADTMTDLLCIRGSKYVQSDTSAVYERVAYDLKSGTRVLFSGTPCQVSALKSYTKHQVDLFCIDIVCHGVPSPRVFKDYIENLNYKYHSKAEKINFRFKSPGWSVFSMLIQFQNGAEYISSKFKDPYLGLFLAEGDLTLRESCFQCKFTSPERCGDITLGDFWCIRAKQWKQRGVEKGVNLVVINNQKGDMLFDSIKSRLYCERHNWIEALGSNQSFKMPWKKPILYDQFWKDYDNFSFDEMTEKYHKYDEMAEAKQVQEAHKRATEYIVPLPVRMSLKVFRKIWGILVK